MTKVEPTAATQKLNVGSGSPVYKEAANRLLESGYLELIQNPALGTTMGTYRLGEEGLANAKELRSVLPGGIPRRPNP